MNRWDPISLYKQMSGNDRVFIVYLVLIFVFSLVRSLRLGWKLWLFSPAGRVSSDQRKPDASDLLAAIALANKLPNNNKTTETPWQVVEGARPRFEYLWGQSVTRVAAMKNCAILTLILSGLVLSYDLMKFLTALEIERPLGDADVAGGPAEMLVPLVLGFAVAAVLYALSSLYAGALARRKAAWNLFVTKVDSQHKTD
jgi:hypothetical protein